MKKQNIKYTCAYCVIEKINHKEELFPINTSIKSPSLNGVSSFDSPRVDTQTISVLSHSSIDLDGVNTKSTETVSTVDASQANSNSSKTGDIFIIDGINNPQKFSDSSVIKKEIKKYKNLNVKFTYQLSRGGIAVHINQDTEAQLLKSNWPVEAFDGSGESIKIHEIHTKFRCVLKNVPTIVSESEIKQEINSTIGEEAIVRRLKYKDSGKPLRVVIVECESQDGLQTLLNSKVRFRNVLSTVSFYHSKRHVPTRCFNCQKYSHIAKLCKNKTVCENCGEEHTGVCEKEICCHNCKGKHKASSRFCPVYLTLLDRLRNRK